MKAMDKSTQMAVLGLGTVALVLYVLYLPGQIAAWFRCGSFTTLPSVLHPLGFLNPSRPADASVYGVTASKCGPESGAVIFWMILLVLVAVVLIVGVWKLVHDWKLSDEYFVNDIMGRDGLAKVKEVRATVGEKKIQQRAKSIRPTLEKPTAADASITMGHVLSQAVLVSCEESIVLVGPPRSGKGFHLLISAILDAPGSVITTSTRADNFAATHALREAAGSICTLFDPQGLTGAKSSLKWSPITGCERPEVAARRASSLIGFSGLGQSSSNQEWAGAAITILQSLLHAAALGGLSVDELYLWGTAPATASAATKILEDHPDAAFGWGKSLKSILDGDPKMLGSRWFGVEGALAGLAVPLVRETLKPATPEEALDPRKFIQNRGTLYLIGTKSGGGAMAPFLIAMMDEITETAREMAIRLPGNRLDPPMSLVLDEIANMSSSWPGLVTLMSDGGGIGISPFVVLQSLAQARGGWGAEEAQAVFDSATVKIQLGGSGNDKDLESFVKLLGTRTVTEQSVTHTAEGFSSNTSKREKDVLTVAELRRLPFGYGLFFGRNGRPFLMKMTRWRERPDAKLIEASIGKFNKSLLAELTSDDKPSKKAVRVNEEVPG
jgi:type IV secretion system protein VirD4